MRNAAGTVQRDLAWAGQLLAWSLILFPLTGLVLANMAPGPSGVIGRLRILGTMVDTMVIPLMGFFLGAFLAEFYQQRGLRIFYTVITALSGLVLIVATVLFGLDIVQARNAVSAEMRQLFDLNSLRSMVVMVFASLMLLLLALGLWRRIRRDRPAAAQPASRLVGTAAP